ncbi:glycosyltransferase family 2 protein [Frisingicoccus sp.]|uniref:glycosyltransferase family 2 protein n=1 Tax=Frisingicoccus sp. TaxID=1918627 RepID=UPI003AB15C73
MKISVIIPIYNGEKYVYKCLDSVRKQTFQNIEIVIVNDGSTDGTKEILERFVEQNSNLVIKIINKKNEGLPQARKTGVEHSEGEYIGFLDVDDWIEPDMYFEMAKEAQVSNADVVCCGIQMDYANKTKVMPRDIKIKEPISGVEALEYLHNRTAIFPYAWNKIYKKEILEEINYPKGNFVGEDYTIVVQVLEKAKTVCMVSGKGYHYVQIPDSMCRGGYNKNYIYAYINYRKIALDLSRKYPQYRSCIYNYVIVEYMAMVIAMGKNKTYNHKMIKSIQRAVRKNLVSFLRSKDVPIIMKGSAIALSIHYYILIIVYNVIAKL